ncbi:restriction endonuclease [Coraliomargarita sp. W4R72]
MADNWKEYQEEAADFFRALGLEAETDAVVQGVRTKHDIDVLVKAKYLGFEVIWIVECKRWSRRVSKLHVLALREIVSDIGADRGILLSESGFQSGAPEAANLTNVQLSSLAQLSISSEDDVFTMRLRDLYERVESCNDRYWKIPKRERIEHGLRPDLAEYGYSSVQHIELVRDLLSRAFRGAFPFQTEASTPDSYSDIPSIYNSPQEVYAVSRKIVDELDQKLLDYESKNS